MLSRLLSPSLRWFLLVVLGVATLLAYMLWQAYQDRTQQAAATAGNLVEVLEARLDSALRRTQATLVAIAAEVPPEALTRAHQARYGAAMQQRLAALAAHFPEITGLRLIDREGNVLYRSEGEPPDASINARGRSYFETLRAEPGRPIFFSEVGIGKISQRLQLFVAVPIRDRDGGFIGVAMAPLELERLQALFASLDLGPNGVVTWRRSDDGRLVLRLPARPNTVNQVLHNNPLHLRIEAGDSRGTIRYEAAIDRQDRIYAYKRVGDYPFYVAVGLAARDFLAEWHVLLQVSVGGSLLALCLLGLALWRLEHSRAREQAAEQASVAKSAFLANMSHEIRTPLNAISGMAHLIRRGGLSPRQAAQLDKLQAAGEHLLHILDAVLDLSKIESGKFSLEHAPFSVSTVIDDVVALVHARAQAKGLVLRQSLPADLPDRVLGDRTRLQQALLNYAANAVKFTEQGEVRLEVNVVERGEHDLLLRFAVSDTGIGIDPAALPRLFGAFEQAEQGIARQYGGTGLGLAITRKLAGMMGGEVGVSSRQGEGSIFWMTARLALPAALEHAGEVATADGTAARDGLGAGQTVLLVEDEPINREIGLCLLEEAGFRVLTANDGLDALALAARPEVDLILMDVHMPRLYGQKATRRIRAAEAGRGRRVPIIALTANAFVEDRERCLAAGMDDFVSKPFLPETLHACLRRHLAAAATA